MVFRCYYFSFYSFVYIGLSFVPSRIAMFLKLGGFLFYFGKIVHKLRTHEHRGFVGLLECQFAAELVDAVVVFLFHPALQAAIEFFHVFDAVPVET